MTPLYRRFGGVCTCSFNLVYVARRGFGPSGGTCRFHKKVFFGWGGVELLRQRAPEKVGVSYRRICLREKIERGLKAYLRRIRRPRDTAHKYTTLMDAAGIINERTVGRKRVGFHGVHVVAVTANDSLLHAHIPRHARLRDSPLDVSR